MFNINVAEWGDSYRILRAALFIDNVTYPMDEKRPPLFSALISVFPQQPDPVFWGRFTVFLLGLASFLLYLQILRKILMDTKMYSLRFLYIGGLLYLFNPVILYWSLRVMGDVLFMFLVLGAFYLSYFTTDRIFKFFLIGLVCGLAILTRFEGYLLAGSFGILLLYEFVRTKRLHSIIAFGIGSLALVLPYLLWRNPFQSSYFGEPQNRSYDVNMLILFSLSFVFMFGFATAFAFIPKGLQILLKNSKNHALLLYLGVQTFLVLLWPAAVPRLFLPIIPFLLICFVIGFKRYSYYAFASNKFVLLNLVLLVLFVVGQYFFKLQFLVVNKPVFIFIVFISFVSVVALYFHKLKYFGILIVLSSVVWSLTTVYSHKDLYKTLIDTSHYVLTLKEGDFYHNDTASIVEWYLNDLYPNDGLKGYYQSLDNDTDIEYNVQSSEEIQDYLIVTNEDRAGFDFEPNDPTLELVYKSENFTNGALFFTKVYKINE
jgi:4-amino-4-deoxy-L-arabinose transferase-like glycosyltransferase